MNNPQLWYGISILAPPKEEPKPEPVKETGTAPFSNSCAVIPISNDSISALSFLCTISYQLVDCQIIFVKSSSNQ